MKLSLWGACPGLNCFEKFQLKNSSAVSQTEVRGKLYCFAHVKMFLQLSSSASKIWCVDFKCSRDREGDDCPCVRDVPFAILVKIHCDLAEL